MKFIHYVLFTSTLFLTACADHPAKTFTPVDSSPVGSGIKNTAASIHKASGQADVIYQSGAVAKSQALSDLKLSLVTAEGNATQLQKAFDDFKNATQAQQAAENKEIQDQTNARVSAQKEVAGLLPHLNRLRVAIFVAAAIEVALALLGPWIVTSTGYLTTIQAIPVIGQFVNTTASVFCALAGGVVLAGLVGLLALFGVL